MSGVSFQRYLGGRLRQYGPLRLAGRFLAQVWRPRAWQLFFKMYRDRDRVARSPFFDAGWYRREYPDVARSGADPAFHYASSPAPRLRDPGPGFCSDEYLALNPDVRYVRMNPLVHYESHGRREGRPVSFLDVRAPVFPEGAVECSRDFGTAPAKHRRTALFAAFCPGGRIPETTLLYLRGLREVADDIVLVANSPVFPDEPDRLRGLVSRAEFRHHGAYDFGSYRRAWEIARDAGMLDAARTNELVVANDSCYGPAVPFAATFAAMAGRDIDFWGLTAFRWYDLTHIQSYFFVFRRRVLDGPELGAFLSSVVPLGLRGRVVLHYECRLTHALEEAGYRWDTLVPRDFAKRRGCMPTKLPATLLERYRMPLLKVKALRGDALEDTSHLRELVARTSPALAAALPEPRPAGTPVPAAAPRTVSIEELHASFAATAARIARRAARGEPVRALFTVSSAAMFPAKPLFEAMRADPAFEPRVLVVPDLRWPRGEDPATLDAVRADLVRTIPAELVRVARPDAFGDYPDDFADADVVCHDTPYDVTSFRYRPRRALAGGYLPVHVNYGFFRSVYDRGVMARQNYAYFWKAFFECPETLAEYREHSILRGANAELAGYAKMDALAAYPGPSGPRKRVLVCPHHSVEGGANDELALSNFLRLADFLAELPARFPEIDFVLRPHPFLFEVLARPRFWGPGKCAAWRERFLAHPNARWSEGGDYLREFAAADAMVQDCGSFLVEWMYTGRPCCYVLKSDRDLAKFAPLGRECLSHCTVARDAAGIEAFLRDAVLGGRDPGAAARDAFRRRIAVNYPHAAAAALAAIRRGIGIG